MYTPKWLKDKDKWTLSDTFKQGINANSNHPKVGKKIGQRKIIGVWVGPTGYLKAYQTRCDCGRIDEYVLVRSLKAEFGLRCIDCGPIETGLTILENRVHPNIKYLYEIYGDDVDIAKDLWGHMIYRVSTDKYKRFKIKVHPSWYNFETFLKYIICLEDYDNKDLTMDRIDTYKGYVPGNIRFITETQNKRNARSNIQIKKGDELISLQNFIDTAFIPITKLQHRKISNAAYANHENKVILMNDYIHEVIRIGLGYLLK